MAKKIRGQLDRDSGQKHPTVKPLTLLSTPSPRGPGRPPLVNQDELLGRRDSLVSVLEPSWGEIGSELKTARTTSDIVKVFSALKSALRAFPLEYFCGEATTPDSPLKLQETRRELWQISQESRKLHEARDKQAQLVTEAQTALAQAENKPEIVDVVEAELATRQAELDRLESEIEKARIRRENLERNLHNQEAFLAQTELLRFIRSRRYALTPRNLANAMAGLPHIGWRQSFKRCAEVDCPMALSLNYQVFQAIAYVLRRKQPRSAEGALRLFQGEVPRLSKKYELARKYITENWQHLREAIEGCWKIKSHPKVLPFRLTSAFVKSVYRPRTALERVLAARERFQIDKPSSS